MIVKMDIWNRHAELIFLSRMERPAGGWLRHVFTNKPHAGRVLIKFHRSRVFTAPSCKIEVVSEPGSEERQAEVQRLHVVTTNEFPPQITVVPPTTLQTFAGKFGESLAIRQDPEVV